MIDSHLDIMAMQILAIRRGKVSLKDFNCTERNKTIVFKAIESTYEYLLQMGYVKERAGEYETTIEGKQALSDHINAQIAGLNEWVWQHELHNIPDLDLQKAVSWIVKLSSCLDVMMFQLQEQR